MENLRKNLCARTVSEAIAIQRRLATRVREKALARPVRWVAGVDAAFTRDEIVAAAVLWDHLAKRIVEEHVVRGPIPFPYVPGLLSFREAPAILLALDKLRLRPDVILCDGQGRAHPRRFGLACHIGVLARLPTIGCAKSRLVGDYREPARTRGAYSPLEVGGEVLGAVVRTREGVRPVFVSVGHWITLSEAVHLVLQCAGRYRLPEPLRRADQISRQAARAIAD